MMKMQRWNFVGGKVTERSFGLRRPWVIKIQYEFFTQSSRTTVMYITPFVFRFVYLWLIKDFLDNDQNWDKKGRFSY